MLKDKMRDNPVINLHLASGDKQALKLEAEKNGMQTTTFVRMIVLNYLKNKDVK
jgi:hypothetical protein